MQAAFAESANSWSVDVADIDAETHDLSVKNLNKAEASGLRDPREIIEEIAALDAESAGVLQTILALL